MYSLKITKSILLMTDTEKSQSNRTWNKTASKRISIIFCNFSTIIIIFLSSILSQKAHQNAPKNLNHERWKFY